MTDSIFINFIKELGAFMNVWAKGQETGKDEGNDYKEPRIISVTVDGTIEYPSRGGSELALGLLAGKPRANAIAIQAIDKASLKIIADGAKTIRYLDYDGGDFKSFPVKFPSGREIKVRVDSGDKFTFHLKYEYK